MEGVVRGGAWPEWVWSDEGRGHRRVWSDGAWPARATGHQPPPQPRTSLLISDPDSRQRESWSWTTWTQQHPAGRLASAQGGSGWPSEP